MTMRYSLGSRFAPKGDKVELIRDKLARRMLRARLTRINRRGESKLHTCRVADLELAKLAINSHQRKRAIAADRKDRRAQRQATP